MSCWAAPLDVSLQVAIRLCSASSEAIQLSTLCEAAQRGNHPPGNICASDKFSMTDKLHPVGCIGMLSRLYRRWKLALLLSVCGFRRHNARICMLPFVGTSGKLESHRMSVKLCPNYDNKVSRLEKLPASTRSAQRSDSIQSRSHLELSLHLQV